MHGHVFWCSIAGIVAVLALGGGAARAAGFPDPTGDVRGGAGPDLTSVSVSRTRSTVTFQLRFAAAPPLGQNAAGSWIDMLLIGLDVPPRSLQRTAHGWIGADYYLGTHGLQPSGVLVKAKAGAGGKILARPKVTRAGRTLVISIARRALGDPVWFDFAVAVGREGGAAASGGGSDEAPARGAFHYRLR